MRVVSIGTFLLPRRFSLVHLMNGGSDLMARALRAEFTEFDVAAPYDHTGVLLDRHRSAGARAMETMLFSGALEIDRLGRVELHLSGLSVGFIVVERDLPDDLTIDLDSAAAQQTFGRYEKPVTSALAASVHDWATRAAAVLPDHMAEPAPKAALPSGQMLWWHRVAVNPPDPTRIPAAHWYGVSAALADGVTVSVGNGFTCLYGGADKVDDVVEGLMIATQEWLLLDEAKRQLSDQLVRLSTSRPTGPMLIDDQYVAVLRLTEETSLRSLVLDEEMRYLANARCRVRDAAAEAWRNSASAADLDQRTTALRDLFALHRERLVNERDDRRNSLVFVFTTLTLLQLVLDWYDFLTEEKTAVARSPRPLIAMSVLVLVALILAVGVVVRRRSRLIRPGRTDAQP